MIEVERKISLNEEDLRKIEQLGTFLGCRILTDTYFDTADFRYTTSDIWLRERECKFELKVGIRNLQNAIDRYEETTDEATILKKLGLEEGENIEQVLEKAQIFPYATFQTARRKYQMGKFTLDLDLAYFDDFIYRIAEVEVIVHTEEKIPEAEEEIEQFIEKLGLDSGRPIRAKLIEFLSQKNPTHYRALQASGIVD